MGTTSREWCPSATAGSAARQGGAVGLPGGQPVVGGVWLGGRGAGGPAGGVPELSALGAGAGGPRGRAVAERPRGRAP